MTCIHRSTFKKTYAADGHPFRATYCELCQAWEVYVPGLKAFADEHLTLTPSCAASLRRAFSTPGMRERLRRAGISQDRLMQLVNRRATPDPYEQNTLSEIARIRVEVS